MSNTVKMNGDICIINEKEYIHLDIPEKCDLQVGEKLYHIRLYSGYSESFLNQLFLKSGNSYAWFHISNTFVYGKILYLGVKNTFYVVKEQYCDEY